MSIQLSGREFDTILAALLMWKTTGFRHTMPAARKFLHVHGLPLSNSEIEILLEKLQGITPPAAEQPPEPQAGAGGG